MNDVAVIVVLAFLWGSIVAGVVVVFWALRTAGEPSFASEMEALGGCVERARRYDPAAGMRPAARANSSTPLNGRAVPRN